MVFGEPLPPLVQGLWRKSLHRPASAKALSQTNPVRSAPSATSKLRMHGTNVVLHVPNLIQNPICERCLESHDLNVFVEIISRCACQNSSAPGIHIISVTYDLRARHDRTLPFE